MDLGLLLEAEKRGLLPPDKVALLGEARKRGLVPGGNSPAPAAEQPADVPSAGDMSQWQRSPPVDPVAQRAAAIEQMRGPHSDTVAEKIVANPLVRAGAGALQTAVVGPLQLGANIGRAISPPSKGQFDLAQEIADANQGWGNTVDSAMGGRADVAGTVGAMAAGALALPGAVPESLLGRMWYGAKSGGVLGAMAPHEKAGLEENVKSGVVGAAAGGLIPLGLEGLNKLGKIVYHAGIEPHFDAGRTAIKGRAYLDALGDRATNVAQALRLYQPKVPGSVAPAGEAAADVGSAEFSAMQNSAEGVLPSEYVARGKERDAARLAQVRTVGQTPEALETARALRARNAEVNYGAVENDLVDADLGALEQTPAMQSALGTARTSAAQRRAYFPEDGEPYNVRNLQRAKKALDDSITASQNSTMAGRVPTLSPSELTGAKRELVGKLETASPGWKAARDQFAEESVPINQMETGQFLEGKLTNALDEEAPQRAAAYANALRDAPKTIKNAVTGSPRFKELTDVLTPEQVAVVESVRDDLAAMAEQQRLARAGARSGKNVMQAFTNSIDATGHNGLAPNMLDRGFMLFNFIMRRLKGQMDEKLAREIAQEMLDPKATGRAIETAIARRGDIERTASALRRRSTQGAALAGQAAAGAGE